MPSPHIREKAVGGERKKGMMRRGKKGNGKGMKRRKACEKTPESEIKASKKNVGTPSF